MTNTTALRIAAGIGFLGVALGAFGAHALKGVLVQHNSREIWETAVLYHLVHAIMLVVLAYRAPFPRGAWACFLAGIVIFSGSLYLLAGFNLRWLGAVTPIGGVGFLAGWIWLMLCKTATGASRTT